MTFPQTLATLVLALLIDRVFGEPTWLWTRIAHPAVLIGRAVERLEGKLNRLQLPFAVRRRRGAMALAGLVGAGAGLGWAIQTVLAAMPFGFVPAAVLASTLLAQKSLVDHVSAVAQALEAGGLAAGRAAVALIVGRDVSVLDDSGVSRAAIESAAENFSDALVAPALCFAALGLPGLIVYKIANTADSMIGHRSERYEAYGWAAARLDDGLNLAPARLSALLIALAALISGGQGGRAIRSAWHDARRHRSPNAGWPEAAAAGALGLALGGPRRYGDLVVDGAWFNAAGRADAAAADIRFAVRLIDAAWGLVLAAATAGAFIVLGSWR